MNKQQLEMMWDHMRKMHGVGLRCIQAIPADKLDSKPIAGMRTTKELVVHLYGMVIKQCAESVIKGSITELDEKPICATIRSRDELVSYARTCWEAADKAANVVTEVQLQAMVKTPWGKDLPGFAMFMVVQDEYLHHRGQLYAYLRQLGVEPPVLWDFANNEPAFQPKETVQA